MAWTIYIPFLYHCQTETRRGNSAEKYALRLEPGEALTIETYQGILKTINSIRQD
jgi:hypothetical protein